MRRSTDRILTSHVGSLPRPDDLLEVNRAKLTGEGFDEKLYAQRLRRRSPASSAARPSSASTSSMTANSARRRIGAIDYGPWISYVWGRLGGWEFGEPGDRSLLPTRRDRIMFADFYREFDGTGFIGRRARSRHGRRFSPGRSPISGQAAVRADLDNLKAAVDGVNVAEAFVTSVAPGSFSRRQNRYYKTDEEFQFALAEALREEYKAIIDAGFVLQLDDPGLPTHWDCANPEPSIAD